MRKRLRFRLLELLFCDIDKYFLLNSLKTPLQQKEF